MVKAFEWVFARTLRSVWFGIGMMVLVALYVAVGSGRADVREYFEMDELAFFQAWPLKVVMGLLVLNLVVVTFTRIPFTLPRYGVWAIHAGIVTLIYGMSYYYSFKVEGLAFVPRGGSAEYFYDRWERSLFVRVPGVRYLDEHVLTGLPRFKAYDGRDVALSRLGASALRDLEPVVPMPGANGSGDQYVQAATLMGVKEAIRLDVVGYWPYAQIVTNYVEGRGSEAVRQGGSEGNAGGKEGSGERGQGSGKEGDGGTDGGVTGLMVEAKNAKGESLHKAWVVSDDVNTAGIETMGDLEVEHRTVPDVATGQQVAGAALKIHTLEVTVGGTAGTSMNVEVGGTYKVGGYEIVVEAFDPAFPAMNGEVVQLITLMVTPPADSAMKGEKFRRQVIFKREKVTDWKLGVEGAGPMGKRQDAPLDTNLVTHYVFNDALDLLPRQGTTKRVIITSPAEAGGSGRMWVVATSKRNGSRADEVKDGRVELEFGQGEDRFLVTVERRDNLHRLEDVVEVPREKRSRDAGEEGLFQVVAVRVKVGSGPGQVVLVPYQKWAMTMPWRGGVVKIPGTDAMMQLQLGSRTRPIAPDREGRAAVVMLKEFELVKYAGGSSMSGMQRDFKSHLIVKEGNGREREGVAHMNSPIYFGPSPMLGVGDSYWTLFQAQWDPNGQAWTVLGVGNRPGIWIMMVGCFLMAGGLVYAFYVKPLVLKRMKENAIKAAAAKGKKVKQVVGRPVVMEGVEGRNLL